MQQKVLYILASDRCDWAQTSEVRAKKLVSGDTPFHLNFVTLMSRFGRTPTCEN